MCDGRVASADDEALHRGIGSTPLFDREARELAGHAVHGLGGNDLSLGRGGYAAEANDEVVCLAMIETAAAMENLEEIVSTPGLDGVYIGPADLTLGVTNGRLAPGFDREEPEMVEAIQKILSAAKAAGRAFGAGRQRLPAAGLASR